MISPDKPLQLLGGLTPARFMRDYWQRKPLLIRQAIPNFRHTLSIRDIRELVSRDEVESRLIWRDDKGWHMKQGPFSKLPAQKKTDWTVLAQSVDLHDDATAELMHQFRFIADARLDDAMISVAGAGGGVGPHFDSYDVFLLQAHGRRHWRISQQSDLSLEPGLPLKILWAVLDLIAIVVLASGLYLWLRKPKTTAASVSKADGSLHLSLRVPA